MKNVLWLSATVAALIAVVVVLAVPTREMTVENSIVVAQEEPRPVRILAFGDIMLDRGVRTQIDTHGVEYLFEKIKQSIAGHDIVVANAEGVFTDNKSISASDHTQLVFTFATSSLPALRSTGFTIFSQANNHALNFGWDGLKESQTNMRAAGLQTFGDPDNVNPGPLYKSVRGDLVAFVGYSQFATDGGTSSSTLAAIRAAKTQNAFVVVYPHWGDEYNLATTSLQTTLAHKFIDAGADAVLGSHPHVVEPVEIYNGKAIFYSMGNFIFDQSWETAVSHGLAVEITLTKTEVVYRLIPYSITNAQPEPTGEESRFVLER